MISLLGVIIAVVWWLGAIAVRGTADPRTARRWAVVIATGTLVLAVGGVIASEHPAVISTFLVPVTLSAHGVLLLTLCLSGLMIVGLSPAADHPPSVLETVACLVGLACALAAVDHPTVRCLLWTVSAILVWRRCSPHLDWRFAAHQGPGAALFAFSLVTPVFSRLSLAAAVVIRMAAVPAHSWLPRFVEGVPSGVVAAFLLTPVGVSPMITGPYTIGPGLLSAVIGAILGLTATRPERAMTYLLISAAGILLTSVDGGARLWPAWTLTGTGVLMTLAAVRARRGRLSIGGDLARTPRLAAAFLLFALGLIGFPLLIGFPGQESLIHGSPVIIALTVATAVAVNGIIVMRVFLALFAGRPTPTAERDLLPMENYVVTTALFAVVATGLFPDLLLYG